MGAEVSDTDSFINEVTEEVRRDQLYGYLRKYGWIAAVAVVAIVGTAAYVEYSKATAAAEAQDGGRRLNTCSNECFWTPFNGICDDGGPGSEYHRCHLGLDCADCGWRQMRTRDPRTFNLDP